MINGGFFVLSPSVISLIESDLTVWEGQPLETLARDNQIAAFEHTGFWQPMDTLRDKNYLEELWATGAAPWKSW
jgi:glucose-1-phosphate cytidylyltransferase